MGKPENHRKMEVYPLVNVYFFLQQRSHLQAKKLGEDGVGECHLIWMQASLNQKNSRKGGTKLSGLFFCSKFGGTPHQESEDMIRKMES